MTAADDRPLRIAMLTPLNTEPLRCLLHDPEASMPPGIGGPGPTDLIVALARAGHHVTAITLEPRVTRPTRHAGPNLDLVMVPMRSQHRGRDAYRPERAAMAEVLAELDVDLVHAQWTYEYALVAAAADVPHLVTVRDWAPLVVRYNPIPYWAVKLAMNIAVLARRPRLTTPSPSVLSRLSKVGFRDVRHIPNGLRVADVAVEEPRRERRDPPVLLSVTNEFSGRKNTETLMTAFQIVRRRHPGARLRLVGSEHGPGEEAEAWARANDATRDVEFMGQRPREEVLDLMDEADILVHPAREEPFGIVVIEAMGRGLPVVGGAQSGGVPFILDHGAAGEVVDVESPEAIAAGILVLLGDADRWAARSAQGLTRVRQRFDVSRIAEDYVQAYRDLLADRW